VTGVSTTVEWLDSVTTTFFTPGAAEPAATVLDRSPPQLTVAMICVVPDPGDDVQSDPPNE
jgi:hypothetical protein